MKIHMVCCLLFVSTIFTLNASSSSSLRQPLLAKQKSAGISSPKSYSTIIDSDDITISFCEDAVKSEARAELVPLARIILHSDVLQKKLEKKEPKLAKVYFPGLIETMQESHIRKLSELLIVRHDRLTCFFTDQKKLKECVTEVQKLAQNEAKKKKFLSKDTLFSQEQSEENISLIDSIPLDEKYELMWAKYYITLDEAWLDLESSIENIEKQVLIDNHKKKASKIMREILAQYDPATPALIDQAQFNALFEDNYAVFLRLRSKSNGKCLIQ